jgi:hypothetical protein
VQLPLEDKKERKSDTSPECKKNSLMYSRGSGGLRMTMKLKEILYVTRIPH